VASLWVEARPHQWVKNLFVLAPLLFSQNLFAPAVAVRALEAFALFCLISSSAYLLNDIRDREQDRLHPTKRLRPLAAGQLSPGIARAAMVVLLLSALGGGVLVDGTLALILGTYWVLNLCYSTWLKHLVILDVFSITAGFVLRVSGGAVATRVEMSDWLIICATLLALFLGFSKRRHELATLRKDAANHRQVLEQYNLRFLDMMIGIATGCAVMSYALYAISEQTVSKYQTRKLLLTLPFVLYGIFRYLYLTYHKDQGGDPALSLLSDRPMLVNLCLWTLSVIAILYWR
jgi:4-hydroxybenzoate polyprenyltransferase